MALKNPVHRWEARNWDTKGSIPHSAVYLEATQGRLSVYIPTNKGRAAQNMMIVGAPLWYAIGLPLLIVTVLDFSGAQRLSGLMLDLFLLIVWPAGAILVAVYARRQGMVYAMQKPEAVLPVTKIRGVTLGLIQQDILLVVNGENIDVTVTARASRLMTALKLTEHPIDLRTR
jgi:hypothetical protein